MVKRLLGQLRQAGGIVVRMERGQVRVLVVTARKKRNRWVFPKGTVKRNEEPADAAVREVEEEAGVTGDVIDRLGTVRYPSRDGFVRLEYFLIAYSGPHEEESEEAREVVWCAVEDAIKLLTYASARRILLEAHPRILEHAAQQRSGSRRASPARNSRRR